MNIRQYVYILKSDKDDSLYIGCTRDLTKRIKDHNQGLSVYTKAKKPWSLIWYAVFSDIKRAFEFERYLKSSSGKAFASKRFY